MLREIYDNQQNPDIKQEGVLPATPNATPRTNYQLIIVSSLIGVLVGSLLLAPVLTLYIEQRIRTTTSTTTTTTSSSTTSSTSTSSTSTSSTSTSTTSTATTTTTTTTVTTLPLTPSGVIWLWSGSIATVPQGWAVCDGTLGTPDLRDRFIVGSGSGALYSPTQTGGSSTATATITVQGTTITTAQMPSHSHGGSTGIENVAQIYYDFSTSAGSYGPFSLTLSSRWVNTKGYDTCSSCQHTHSIASEGGNQPHTHTASMSSINITPPFAALLYIMKL